MRVVTWNCNGALRKKFEHLSDLNADIYVIQECEDPVRIQDKVFNAWAENYLWTGENKHKGIGIFVNSNLKIELLNWDNQYKDHTVKHFLPCLINGDIQVLGIWTHKNNSPNFGYIGQVWKYLQVNKEKFGNMIIAGDFNSNTIWDEWDRWWNHSDVVKELKEIDIESLYHNYFKEEQGKESQPTFFLHRNQARPYHIDYMFASEIFSSRLSKLEIGKVETWLKISDHLPLVCEFNKAQSTTAGSYVSP